MTPNQCEKCRKSFDNLLGAYCPGCLAEVRAGNRFAPASNERPPKQEPPVPVCLDVEGARVYDYDPKFRGRMRKRATQ